MKTESDNREGAPAHDVGGKFEAGKAHVKQAAGELRAAAEQKAAQLRAAAEAKAHEYRVLAEESLENARKHAHNLQEQGEHYVRENPLRGILMALGAGFILGLLFRR